MRLLTRSLAFAAAVGVLAASPAGVRLVTAFSAPPAQAVAPADAPAPPEATTTTSSTTTTVPPTTTPPPAATTPPPPAPPAPAPAPAPRPAPVAAPRPAPAPAPRPAGPDRAPGWEARMGAQALTLFRYPVSALGFQISFLSGRPGRLGVTYLIERRIEIYVRTTDTVQSVARTLGHELGHAVDTAYGNASRRAQYKQLRGIPDSVPWYGCDGCTDYATPAGDFAETFGYWQLGPGPYKSQMAPAPSVDQLSALVPLFNA